MSPSPGVRLGPYQVVALLGAGGMGEVYRATDTRLGRDVALKLLPPEFAADPDRLARFEREAKLLASLQHPNVATLFGLEEADGQRVLAMELVPGEDLAERLKRGPIPVEDAIAVARQIAEALEEAHEHGIVHRDLKPANVKLTPDGKVKVLDFGLAKAWSLDPGEAPSGSRAALSQSPTLAHTGTAAGIILGTAAYMSPEQARGKPVDRRADIWAFGVVLFEMLSGRRLFDGETVTDVLAAVVTREPDFASLPAATPAGVRQLLQRCLRKDPKRRLRDIGDARIALEEAVGGAGDAGVAGAAVPPTRVAAWRRVLPWAMAAFALSLFGLGQWRAPHPEPSPLRKHTIPIRGLQVTIPTPPVLSPDGRHVAYVAANDLWVRDLAELEGRRLVASVSPTFPFWSPDSAQIAYIADQKLWRVAATGGQPLVVAEASFARGSFTPGGVWLPDDTIVFAPAANGTGLIAVPARGGTFTTFLDRGANESDFHKPSALPGGRGILFVVDPDQGTSDTIEVVAGGRRKTILKDPGHELNVPVYASSGHLLFVREGREGSSIWAAPFSLEKLETTGAPFPVAQAAHWPSVGADGTLVYAEPRAVLVELAWLGPDGRVERSIGEPLQYLRGLALSPDGTRVAAAGGDAGGGALFVRDRIRGTNTRLTFDDRVYREVAWTPDGQSVVYRGQQGSRPIELFVKRADGSGDERLLGPGDWPAVSPDGRFVMFDVINPGTGGDLYYVPLEGGASPKAFLEGPGHVLAPAFSPDGRFVALTVLPVGSDRPDVFLRPFPPAEGVWQVSSAGGTRPRWSRRGDRLYFVQGNDLMQVEVKLAKTPWLGPPRLLFAGGPARLQLGLGYDVAPDGSGFVAIRELPDPEATIPALTLVESWFEEFRASTGK